MKWLSMQKPRPNTKPVVFGNCLALVILSPNWKDIVLYTVLLPSRLCNGRSIGYDLHISIKSSIFAAQIGKDGENKQSTSTRNYNRQAPGANTSGASFTNSQIHTKMNLRSEIIKKFGVRSQKSSELFAYVKKFLYLCTRFGCITNPACTDSVKSGDIKER